MGFSGSKAVESPGRQRHTPIVRDKSLRYTWVHVLRYKSDAVDLFYRFLASSPADDIPSKVIFARSDGGGEFHGGTFRDLCR